MIVTNFFRKRTRSSVIYSADFHFQNHSLNQNVWFKVPKEYEALRFPYDAFFVAAYPLAAELHEELRIECSVSKKLKRNLPKIVEKIGLKHQVPNIQTQSLTVRKQESTATCQLFTLGVDSFFTLINKDKREATDTHYLLFVNGYDIQLTSQSFIKKTNKEIELTAKHFNAKPIIMSTNLRSLTEQIVDWGRYHGAAMATAGHLFTTQFHTLYFNSSTIHREKIAWGSSKIVDGLWSSEALQCVPFGTDTLRINKVKAVAKSEDFSFIKKRLRVCWSNYHDPKSPFNCSVCEKCLRTQIAFSFFTKKQLPTFETIHLERLSTFDIPPHDEHHWLALWKQSAKYLGKNSPTYLAIQDLLERNYIIIEKPPEPLRHVLKRLLKRVTKSKKIRKILSASFVVVLLCLLLLIN